MPKRKQTQAQTNSKGGNGWWIPTIIGIIMLFIPGGVFITPVMIAISVIMRKRKPKKNPQTSPHSPLPLINITP